MKYVILCVLAVALLHTAVRLAVSGGSDRDPMIEEVVDAYLLASGGRETIEEIQVVHTMDSITIAGLSGVSESWWVREPFSGRTSVDLGIVRQDVLMIGDSVWSLDRNGHLSTGSTEAVQEAELARKTIFYDAFLDPEDLVLGADTLVEGVKCWPLTITGDIEATMYISSESWLPALSTVSVMGIRIFQYPIGYTVVDGITGTTGTRDVIPALGHESVTRNLVTEYNVPVPDTVFSIRVPDADWTLEEEGRPWPFRLSDGHVYLDGSVGGRDVTLLLDSGAGATIIDSVLAAELGLEGIGEFVAQGIGGAESVSFVQVPEYSAAGATFTGQNLAVLPVDEPFYPYTWQHISMILGYDFLSRFVTLLDFGESTISLWDPDSFVYAGEGHTAEVAQTMSLLSIDVLLEDSVQVTLLLDTGAAGTLHFTPTFFDEHPDFLDGRETFTTVARGVGGLDSITAFRVGSLEIGGYRIPGGICSSFEGAPVLAQYHGIIGTGVLARFRVYLDYGNGLLILEPSSLFDEGLPEDMTGMGFETDGQRITVGQVVKGSPGDLAGVEPGDELLSVDGIEVPAGDSEALDDLIPVDEGETFVLTVRRDGRELDLAVTTARLLPVE
jgi:hypothetical protein